MPVFRLVEKSPDDYLHQQFPGMDSDLIPRAMNNEQVVPTCNDTCYLRNMPSCQLPRSVKVAVSRPGMSGKGGEG
nr:hypothetical protein BgiMline_027950 [Biomphalaria glabrata]